MKTFEFIVVALVFLGIGWFAHQSFGDKVAAMFSPKPAEEEMIREEENNNGVICAQVITPAINPETKEIREFPTPCDVPEGWDVIQNDIPGLDLEVQ